MIDETGKIIAEQSYTTVLDFLCDVGLSESEAPVPLELWSAMAQAVADASGYRVVLYGHLYEPIEAKPGYHQIVGYREVARADPVAIEMGADPLPEV